MNSAVSEKSCEAVRENVVSPAWIVRAAQLDLARQKETLDAIEDYIRFIAEWGYNTLLLYVEGAIQTRSFAFRKPELSYGEQEIRQIVKTAGELGIDVIPCVATLGHAEHFFEKPGREHLAEQGGRTFPHGSMFCPSEPAVYELLAAYMAEVAELFPGKHFHVGCDEAWGLGGCPKCRRRLKEGETFADLLLGHIQKVHGIAASLGKRIWIWDDLLEYLSDDEIARFPRDIVVCSWFYMSEQIDLDGIAGHFNGLRRRDVLALYQRLGMDVVICPWAKDVRNAVEFTRYARCGQVLGGLQTVWELSRGFLPGVKPAVALAGYLWANPDADVDGALDRVLERLLPDADELTRFAAATATQPRVFALSANLQTYLRGPLTNEEVRTLEALRMSRTVLEQGVEAIREPEQREILSELLRIVRMGLLAGKLRRLLPELMDPRCQRGNAMQRQASSALEEIEALEECSRQLWQEQRAGIEPRGFEPFWSRIMAALKPVLSGTEKPLAEEQALLILGLFLKEGYSAARLKVEIGRAGAWQQVFEGTLKPVCLSSSHYTLQIPIRCHSGDLGKLRFSVTGYGGQGISYAKVAYANQMLIPHAVEASKGMVDDAESILVDRPTVCYLGEPDTQKTFLEYGEDEVSSIVVSLRPRD